MEWVVMDLVVYGNSSSGVVGVVLIDLSVENLAPVSSIAKILELYPKKFGESGE